MEPTSPPLEILVRGPDGASVWNGPPFKDGKPSIDLENVRCNSSKFSEDGSVLMVMKDASIISVYDCKNKFKEIRSFQVPNIVSAALSPCGTFLQTFQKSSTPEEKNVVLWRTETGDALHSHFQKNSTKATWPSIRFSSDETVACRLATNEIQFFDPKDFSKGLVNRLRVPNIAGFELSALPGSHVAAFVPESKGSPASVQIYHCKKELQDQPVARRSFFRCSTVQLHWNRGSTGLLVVVQADVDKTNQSYYGETKLNYLTTNGSHEGLVTLRKEGPIHDVQWSYCGSKFVVIYGFVCIAGFGNLPGDMAFWDYEEKKQIGTTRAECSVSSEWSPDGRYFMTATTAPRLQVDNGLKIFHYNGSVFFKKKFDKLYQAEWRPESPDKYPELVDIIKSVASLSIKEAKSQGLGSGAPRKTEPVLAKPAAYRPPHAKQAASIQAEVKLLHCLSSQMSKSALKNKKKREKQKEKKAAAGASETAQASS
ncbi:Eukaryotic translation initiation factor 2A [Linum perenne]